MFEEQSTDVPIIRPNGIPSTMPTFSCRLLQANAAIPSVCELLATTCSFFMYLKRQSLEDLALTC